MEKDKIPILLVEDSLSDIEILKRSLKKCSIPNPVHVVRDGQEAIDFLHKRFVQPGIVILDIHLPKVSGMEVLKEAKRIVPDAVVIMMTGHASVQTAVQSLRREGAFDYLRKSKDRLPEVIDAVRLAIDQRALRLQTRWTVESNGDQRVIDMTKLQQEFDLSNREIDVIKGVCQGTPNRQIGEKLFISELTVKGHLKNIFQKIGVHNRATLV